MAGAVNLKILSQAEIAAALVGKRVKTEDPLTKESAEIRVTGIRFPENPLLTSAICYLQYEDGKDSLTVWDGIKVTLLE